MHLTFYLHIPYIHHHLPPTNPTSTTYRYQISTLFHRYQISTLFLMLLLVQFFNLSILFSDIYVDQFVSMYPAPACPISNTLLCKYWKCLDVVCNTTPN